MFVKFCGFTRERDLEEAVELGIEAAGFIFHERSKRHVTPGRARELVRVLEGSGVSAVGVFVDGRLDDIRNTVDMAGLDIVQVYSPALAEGLWPTVRAIAAHRISGAEDLASIPAPKENDIILLDSFSRESHGGTGAAFNWEYLRGFSYLGRTVVAGGLNENNVAYLVRKIGPFGLDVSSGIETAPGVKSREKMASFMKNLREALLHEKST